MINLKPTVCNLCGGRVEYISTLKVFGKKYGSGYGYHCTKCGAFVGTLAYGGMRDVATGILANQKMRNLRKACRYYFYRQFPKTKHPHSPQRLKEQAQAFGRLIDRLDITEEISGFDFMDEATLKKALRVLRDGDV